MRRELSVLGLVSVLVVGSVGPLWAQGDASGGFLSFGGGGLSGLVVRDEVVEGVESSKPTPETSHPQPEEVAVATQEPTEDLIEANLPTTPQEDLITAITPPTNENTEPTEDLVLGVTPPEGQDIFPIEDQTY